MPIGLLVPHRSVPDACFCTNNNTHTELLGLPIKGDNGSSYAEHHRPWGEKKDHPTQLADDVGYTGHQNDIATGLTYMQARYYDPEIGRSYAVDPVQYTGSNSTKFGKYTYARNNPFRFVDPDGRDDENVAAPDGLNRVVGETVVTDEKLRAILHTFNSGEFRVHQIGATIEPTQEMIDIAVDVDFDLLVPVSDATYCEWKGAANYWALARNPSKPVGWCYERPRSRFEMIKGCLAFYPSRVDCGLDGESVKPQPGGFYGGWITSEVVGPFKGEPGTGHW